MRSKRQFVLAGGSLFPVYHPEVGPGSCLSLFLSLCPPLLPATSEAHSSQVLPRKNQIALSNQWLQTRPERMKRQSCMMCAQGRWGHPGLVARLEERYPPAWAWWVAVTKESQRSILHHSLLLLCAQWFNSETPIMDYTFCPSEH